MSFELWFAADVAKAVQLVSSASQSVVLSAPAHDWESLRATLLSLGPDVMVTVFSSSAATRDKVLADERRTVVWRELSAPGPSVGEALSKTMPEVKEWLLEGKEWDRAKWQWHNWQFALVDGCKLVFGNLLAHVPGVFKLGVSVTLRPDNELAPLLDKLARIGGHIPDSALVFKSQVKLGAATEAEVLETMIRDSRESLFVHLGVLASHATTHNALMRTLAARLVRVAKQRETWMCIVLASSPMKQPAVLWPFAFQWHASLAFLNEALLEAKLTKTDLEWLNSRVLVATLPQSMDAVSGSFVEADQSTALLSTSTWSDFSFGAARCAESALLMCPLVKPLWPLLLQAHGFVVPTTDAPSLFMHAFSTLRSNVHLTHHRPSFTSTLWAHAAASLCKTLSGNSFFEELGQST